MEFCTGGVPVKVAAKVYGKDEAWIRCQMKAGLLPIGVVSIGEKRSNYYISPKLLYEHTGYIYKGGNYERNE